MNDVDTDEYDETELPPNGLRYLRWGGDGEAVQLENDKA